jgi:hypothetical protein
MAEDNNSWKPLDPSVLQARLAEVKALLEQAAAVGLAQDAQKMEKLTELAIHQREEARGPKSTKRYR